MARRLSRNPNLDASRPYAYLTESERSESGEVVNVATVFLTNRECPWRCLMCDLWKNTLSQSVPPGAIPAQIDFALEQLAGPPEFSSPDLRHASSPIRQIKLYNSGSFFDPKAIPPVDFPAIANRLQRFSRVIVECHPSLVNSACVDFRDLLADESPTETEESDAQIPASDYAELEVALGLETAHPDVLDRLNKRMTLDQFRRAAEFLVANQIAVRTFVLVKPPFLDEVEALYWAERSIEFAFDCGASVVSLIPTRPGNGALEALAQLGQFTPPQLTTLESALAHGIGLRRGRVFADVWDLQQFSICAACLDARSARLQEMNFNQSILPVIECKACGNS